MSLAGRTPPEQWLGRPCLSKTLPLTVLDDLGYAGAGAFSDASTVAGDTEGASTGMRTPLLSRAPLTQASVSSSDDSGEVSEASTWSWPARRMPLGLRNHRPLVGATAMERCKLATDERAASFCRRGAADNRKIADAARERADLEAWEALENRRGFESAQASREAAVQRVKDDSLARRAALALRGADFKERRLRGLDQVEVNNEWAQHQRCQEASKRASVRQQRVESIAHSRALAKTSKMVEFAERRRIFEERCAHLDNLAERDQVQFEAAMRLLGKIEC